MNRIEYLGGLNTLGTHEETGEQVKTAAAVVHHGDGSSFSPIDLLCTSVGSCMLTIIGMYARKYEFSIDGATVRGDATMGEKGGRLQRMDFTIDCRGLNLGEKEQDVVRRAASSCPVVLSLHPETEVEIEFIFE